MSNEIKKLKNIKVTSADRDKIDSIKGKKPRNEVISELLSSSIATDKDEILRLIDYIEENTYCPRGIEKPIRKAWAKLGHLLNGA